MVQNIPSPFKVVCEFNAAVSGFEASTWMNGILQGFDIIANNVSNFGSLHEECDVLIFLSHLDDVIARAVCGN